MLRPRGRIGDSEFGGHTSCRLFPLRRDGSHGFSRHYAEATGQTPARAIERLRVEAARRLLSESRLPVKRIALRCGFGSEETMRRSFSRLLATTPQDYRARFST